MKEAIDLYSKMVIGTFSFVGPSFTLLIPLFYTAIQRSREKHELQIEELQKIIRISMEGGSDFALLNEVGTLILKRRIKENKRELNLLNLKRQVKRLFGSLFCSIALIIFYYYQKSHFWNHDDQLIRISTLALSILSFAYGLFILWQMFSTIVRIKSEEEEFKFSKNLSLMPEKP